MPFVRRRQSRLSRQSEKTPRNRPPFSLRLSAPLLALLGVILVLMVGWAFFMGFIVGRGDNPSEQLARFDPFGKRQDVQVEDIQPQEKPPLPVAEENLEKPKVQTDEKTAKAAESGELNPKKDAAETGPEPHPFVRPRGSSMAAWGEVRDGSPDAFLKSETPAEAKQNAAVPRFDYVYRVATFTRKEEAQALAKKLNSGAVRSSVRENGKLSVVLVSLRASEEECEQLLSRLAELKVKNPQLLLKKAVATNPSGNTREKPRAGQSQERPKEKKASAKEKSKEKSKEQTDQRKERAKKSEDPRQKR